MFRSDCELAASFLNPLKVFKVLSFNSGEVVAMTSLWNCEYRYPSSWVITTVILSFKHEANSVATPIQITHVPGVMTVCCLFSAGGTCTHIPQPKHGSNTNKSCGRRACVCVHMHNGRGVSCCVCSQLLPLQVLQESLTQCVSLKYFIRSSRQLQTGLICAVCFNVSVHVWLCLCACVCVFAFVCFAGHRRLLFHGSLRTTHWRTLL